MDSWSGVGVYTGVGILQTVTSVHIVVVPWLAFEFDLTESRRASGEMLLKSTQFYVGSTEAAKFPC